MSYACGSSSEHIQNLNWIIAKRTPAFCQDRSHGRRRLLRLSLYYAFAYQNCLIFPGVRTIICFQIQILQGDVERTDWLRLAENQRARINRTHSEYSPVEVNRMALDATVLLYTTPDLDLSSPRLPYAPLFVPGCVVKAVDVDNKQGLVDLIQF